VGLLFVFTLGHMFRR